jgi:hypothetical protein
VERAREIKTLLKSRFQTAMCEVAHTSVDTGKILLTPARLRRGDSPCYARALCQESTYGAEVCRGRNSTSAPARRAFSLNR